MQVTVYLVCLVGLVSAALALYSPTDDVIQLDAKNFHSDVIMSQEIWFIEFYAPWCGHCQSLAPEWKKAASALKGVVKIAAVDADSHQQLAGQYDVRGFPTIKVFGDNKYKPTNYDGPRTAQGIVDDALRRLSSQVRDRLSGKSGSSGGGDQKSRSGGRSGGGGSDENNVVELTDSNFDELVMRSDDMWLVEFFAPWCGHCKNLEPHWKKAATELKGKMKLGAVDATVHNMISQRYGVQGFPTIKFFAADRSEKSSPTDYDGGRTSADIVTWAMDKVVENVPAPEVTEVTKVDSLTTACADHQLCIISVLPHILDCQAECRNNYIKLLNKLGEKYKKKMWGYVWAEAGSQPEMEESLGIGGFGYPAMAAVNARKLKYTLLRGAFSENGINEFLRDLSFGRGSTAPLKNDKLPPVVETTPWDGKDGVMPVEEDYDLDDVDLDEDSTKSKDEL